MRVSSGVAPQPGWMRRNSLCVMTVPLRESRRALSGSYRYRVPSARAGGCRGVGPCRPAEKQPPSVLILNSYHQGYEWSDNEIEGVLEGLRSADPEIQPAIEHLDLKRFPAEDHQARLRSYLSGKYRNHPIDLALVLDNPALDILLKHRDEILPGVPVVFAGINDFTRGMLSGPKRRHRDRRGPGPSRDARSGAQPAPGHAPGARGPRLHRQRPGGPP